MNTTDNKALADRLILAAEIHEEMTDKNNEMAAVFREAAAALTSPQADKARGESVTLTVAQIIDLAEFAGLRPHALEEDDDGEVEFTICECPPAGVRNEDEMRDVRLPGDPDSVSHYAHVVYCTDYPEEGCMGLGPEVEAPTTTPQPKGDGFTAADMMDARAEERARLSGSQVSGGGEVVAEIRAAMEKAHSVCSELATNGRKYGPIYSHGNSAAWALSAAMKHLNTLAANLSTPQARPDGGEAVKYVRWNPKHGFRWSAVYDETFGDTGTGWTDIPLYLHPAPAPDVARHWAFVEQAFDRSKTSTSERLLQDLGLPSDEPHMPLSWHINRAQQKDAE